MCVCMSMCVHSYVTPCLVNMISQGGKGAQTAKLKAGVLIVHCKWMFSIVFHGGQRAFDVTRT